MGENATEKNSVSNGNVNDFYRSSIICVSLLISTMLILKNKRNRDFRLFNNYTNNA